MHTRVGRRFPEVYLSIGTSGLGSEYVAKCKMLCDAIGPRCVGFDVDYYATRCSAVGGDIMESDGATTKAANEGGRLSWGFAPGKGSGAIMGTDGDIDSKDTCYRKKGGARGTHLQTTP